MFFVSRGQKDVVMTHKFYNFLLQESKIAWLIIYLMISLLKKQTTIYNENNT